ncbi:TonB-dependent receptor [Phenylobacterium sp.]|uniref:TonB-dependent receptor plug domain-containing protein n=1 Tax=Phenylobacterium sp. TaxID=1871053 RepID=UPI002F3F5A0B
MTTKMRFGAAGNLALVAGAAALSVGAHAARAADAELSELVVAGKLEETIPVQLSQYGNRLDVVTSAQIQASGLSDVGQVLSKYVPGLYLAPQSGAFSYNFASLQGSRSNEILYLIDGVRISNRLYNTTPPLDTVPAHMVDRIEVLDGGQGLFFGTQAVAGVINIVTRPFTETTTGRFAIGGDTNDSFTANGFVSGSIGASKLVAYASYDESKGFQPYPDADYQPTSTDRHRGYRLTSAGLKYAYDFSNDVRVSASYQHTQGYVDFARPTDAASAVNDRNEDIATAKLDWTVNDAVQFFVKGYYHNWDSHYDEVDNVPGGGLDHVDNHEFWGFWDYGVNAMVKFTPTTGVETYLGYDMQKYWGRDDVLIIADKTELTQAVFGQVRLTPDLIPHTHLAAGLRYNAPDTGDSATVWNVSGQYDFTDTVFVRGALGTSFRLPDAESLFANDPLFNGEVGNPNLRPETASNLNASVGGETRRWDWELIGFYRETKNLIDLSGVTPDPDVLTFINLPDKVTAKGFEGVGHLDLTPSLSVQGSYTHARTRQSGSSIQLNGVPEDIAQAAVDIHPEGRGFGGSVIANWVGSVFDTVSGGFGPQQHGHYTVVDINGYVAFGPGDHHRINLSLENALDEDYATHLSRATRVSDGSSYIYQFRGVPRTLHVTYSYAF